MCLITIQISKYNKQTELAWSPRHASQSTPGGNVFHCEFLEKPLVWLGFLEHQHSTLGFILLVTFLGLFSSFNIIITDIFPD